MSHHGYLPIKDYAAIGNLRTCAIIGRDGSIDWCCFPHIDSSSVFAAIVSRHNGGRFRLSLAGADLGTQHYVQDSNVLVTEFTTAAGRLSVTDFMPLSGDIEALDASIAPPEIHRILTCDGECEIEAEWSPRFDYARARTSIKREGEGWIATDGNGRRLVLAGLEEGYVADGEHGPELRARLKMAGRSSRVLITRWDNADTSADLGTSQRMRRETVDVWSNWAHTCDTTRSHEWAGDMYDMVIRSELALKLMTHAETGAIAAAPTTSLPETIGGVRNWDYRYAWVRDASLTGQALLSLGHKSSAIELLHWMERVTAEKFQNGRPLPIMYSVHGVTDLHEEELPHFEGYQKSRPVRIGNEAAEQFQLEIYGEVLSSAYELARRGLDFEEPVSGFLTRVADTVLQMWREPDYGIWEIRGEPRHYVYSKVMAWVALDRAIHLAEQFGLQGDIAAWKRERSKICEAVLEHGYSERLGSFKMAFDWDELDAANLRIPLVEFLPCHDQRVQNTINRTMEQLTENNLVYRYLVDDNLPGEEGAFGLCTFWLVDTLALSKRLDEAHEVFESMVRHANHAGLFSEEIDPASGEFLGNFPQAFTHIALINSVLYLAYAEGKPIPEKAPVGTPEHRELINR